MDTTDIPTCPTCGQRRVVTSATGSAWLASAWIAVLTLVSVLALLDVTSWRTSGAIALGATGLVFAYVVAVPTGGTR